MTSYKICNQATLESSNELLTKNDQLTPECDYQANETIVQIAISYSYLKQMIDCILGDKWILFTMFEVSIFISSVIVEPSELKLSHG